MPEDALQDVVVTIRLQEEKLDCGAFPHCDDCVVEDDIGTCTLNDIAQAAAESSIKQTNMTFLCVKRKTKGNYFTKVPTALYSLSPRWMNSCPSYMNFRA